MGRLMHNSASERTSEQEQTTTNQPWQQQIGEPLLWFNRFKRYRGLGPKRSLQAAVEQERGQISALKRPKQAKQPPVSDSRKKETSAPAHLSEVSAPKAVPVSGSWKQASIKWHWVERAQAFDAWQLDAAFDASWEAFLGDSSMFTLPMDRIRALQGLFDAMLTTYNEYSPLTIEQDCQFIARMQSVLRDIKEEMKQVDTAFVEAASRKRLEHWQKNGTKIFARDTQQPR